MHVALNCQLLSMNVTGVTRYITELIHALPTASPDDRFTLLANPGVPPSLLCKAPNVRRQITRFPIVGTKTRILWEQAAMPFEGFGRGFDVVHYTDRSMPWLPTGIPSVSTIQDLSYASFPGTYTRGKVVYNEITSRIVAARADRIIASSQSTKRDVIRCLGVDEEKIRVVHLAASKVFRPIRSPEALQAASTRLGLPDKVVLAVGSLNPRKNLVTLIQAYARLRQQAGVPHKLVLVGPREWKSEPLYQTVKELGIQSEVRLLGWIQDQDLACVYNLAELFVFPSLHEGFGIPPLEAMACGTPVVCSNSASLPEVVGDAAIAVAPTDVEGLAAAMARVLAEPELARQLRGRGLERARLFSWEKTARETIHVYEEVGRKRTERP
jgi:glycosyltransferase involved in cell wall biosynthesis